MALLGETHKMSHAATSPREDDPPKLSGREQLERALGEFARAVRSVLVEVLLRQLGADMAEPARQRTGNGSRGRPEHDRPDRPVKRGIEPLVDITVKLEQLQRALAEEDEVEADAIRFSARKAIKATRGDPAIVGPLRHGLGTLFDILTFTPVRDMSASSVQVLRRHADVLLQGPVNDESIQSMRLDLSRAGFLLRPSPRDGDRFHFCYVSDIE